MNESPSGLRPESRRVASATATAAAAEAATDGATGAVLEDLRGVLVGDLRSLSRVVVAFSGGVDSALVAALAHEALGDRAVAVTAAAETLAARELDVAREVAVQIGIEHRIVEHRELDDPNFVANPRERCYHCQGLRMDLMMAVARRVDDHTGAGATVVVDGTNASDPGPDRPGLAAIRERGVRSPLLERQVDKATGRRLARHLGLSVWDRPSNACLSSRIPHGQIVTLGKLRRIERAEDVLYRRGFDVVRVRHDAGRARVEVGSHEVERAGALWAEILPELLAVGFDAAELDPHGYRSGGANVDQVRAES